jgi:hypothetical protein
MNKAVSISEINLILTKPGNLYILLGGNKESVVQIQSSGSDLYVDGMFKI